MPHKPLFIEDEFKGKSGNGIYADIIEQIDWSVGEVVKALKKNGLGENTFILYTSDNGPATGAGGSAGPLKGTKFNTWEGGHRVPTVMWSPGTIQAGKVADGITSSVDMFQTIAHYAGAEIPKDRTYDGYDLSQYIEGKQSASPRNEFYFYSPNTDNIDGVRIGDWKYVLYGEHRRRVKKTPKGKLYNLKQDIGETTDLADKHPEKVSELLKAMKTFDNKVSEK